MTRLDDARRHYVEAMSRLRDADAARQRPDDAEHVTQSLRLADTHLRAAAVALGLHATATATEQP